MNMYINFLPWNLCGITPVWAGNRVSGALVLMGLQCFVHKFLGTVRTFDSTFVAFIAHVVVEKSSLKLGTTFVLTPDYLILAVTNMLIKGIPREFLVTELADHYTFSAAEF